MTDYVPMTRDGYNRIKAEIERLEKGLMQAKINALKAKLAGAQIVDTSSMPKDRVAFGARVKLKDLKFDDEEEYTLVGAGDEDYEKGRILTTSPFAVAMMGKKVGETMEFKAPGGLMRYEVLEIHFDEA
ncbi:MAG: GreA/GreB family elongation factor [Planctomycetaceae bacterium]|nr:GreA/GreB family elongation factor [Planctomycetaceae bacterium]